MFLFRTQKNSKHAAMHSDVHIVRDSITVMANRYFHVVFDEMEGGLRSVRL